MTLTAPGSSSITINDPPYTQNGWLCEELVIQSGLQTSIANRPMQHGSYIDAAYREGMSVSMTLLNYAGDATTRRNQADTFMQLAGNMLADRASGYAANDYIGGVLDLGVGTAHQRSIRALRLVQPPAWSSVGGALKSVQLVLQTELPYAESSVTNLDTASLTDTGGGFTIPLTIPVTFTAGGAGQVTVTNNGNVEAFPLVQVYGPCTGFALSNLSNTPELEVRSLSFPNASIASGDYWTIDLFRRTVVYQDAGPSMISAMDLASSKWFGFLPTDDVLQMTASGYTASTKARVLMRDAWI